MALKIHLDHSLIADNIGGRFTPAIIISNPLVQTAGTNAIIQFGRGSGGGKGHALIELVNAANSVVKSAQQPMEISTIQAQIQPVAAGLEGDNGSTPTAILFKVDPTSFSNGKIIITFGGTSGTGTFNLTTIVATIGGTAYLRTYTGAGHNTLSFPFRVVDE